MSDKKVRIFGLTRSGTNVLQRAISGNYCANVVQGDNRRTIWKHGCYNRGDGSPVLITFRHPLSWLWAQWKVLGQTKTRNRYRGCKTFEDFIFYNCLPSRECPALHRWSFAAGYWLWRVETLDVPAIVVTWESYLRKPKQTCDKVADTLLLKKDGQFGIVQKQVGPHHTRSGGYELIRRQELDDKEYLEHYTDEMRTFVCERLDEEVLRQLDYEIGDM